MRQPMKTIYKKKYWAIIMPPSKKSKRPEPDLGSLSFVRSDIDEGELYEGEQVARVEVTYTYDK